MTKSSFLDPPFASARVLVISDFNCPYCFALNEWIHELGASNRVRWVGIEHLPSLTVESTPDPDAQALLRTEVADVQERTPEVGLQLPEIRLNSHLALLLQNGLEDDAPEVAPLVRRDLFHAYWRGGTVPTSEAMLTDILDPYGLPVPFLDVEQLTELGQWWVRHVDRIPAMIAPTGVSHLGLQDKTTVRRFLDSALRESSAGPGCR